MIHPIETITLENGLEIMLKEIHTAPLISHWVWYRVGSRDEVTGKTGISHWVEHLQFKGTLKFPADELEKSVSRSGGIWNALTYLDWTTYYETMPADKIDLALSLEADRMANSVFDPLEVEKERTVVISERQGRENHPGFLLREALRAAAFRVHPYHHEILGDLADLQTISRDDLFQHYRSYYTPNNALIAIAGDFDHKVMLDRIKTLYQDIPRGDPPPRLRRQEPPQKGEHQLTVQGPGDTVIVDVAFRSPPAAEDDFFPLLILDSLLSGPQGLNMFGGGGISNMTSRLYSRMVEQEEVAVHIQGGLPATIDPYLYNLNYIVHPAATAAEGLKILEEEIMKLQDTPPAEEEIQRAAKQTRALFAYGDESITNQAFWMGFSEMFATYDWVVNYLDKLAEVTPEEVQRAAQEYLVPRNRMVATYLPRQKGSTTG